MQPLEFAYRREIDGLRAIAVLTVILFHAAIPGFPGGFVGVDVFFVISGYLITSIILSETANGAFSFAGFYERRARRILPPLFLVCAASVPVAMYIMSPQELLDFSKSLLAVASFVSNFFFWAHSGYFDTESELKPLLHTWSLAVEEQFYLIFPIALFVVLNFGRRIAVGLIVLGACASFALAQWGSHHATAMAFYLLPARMWELQLGALIPIIAVDPRKFAPKLLAEALALLGIGLIAIAVIAYHDVPYPGIYTLPPVGGTLLIILFATPETFAGRALGTKPLVAMGLISYSAYLWHQPLFAFARLTQTYEPPHIVFAGLTATAILLAAITYFVVEKPTRDRRLFSRRSVFAFSVAGITCIASFAAAGIYSGGFERLFLGRQDLRTQRAYELIKRYALRDLEADMVDNHDCMFWSRHADAAFEKRFKSCAEKYGGATLTVGDSHGMNVYNALARAHIGEFVVGLVKDGCRPWATSDDCPYTGLPGFLKRNASSVRGIVFNISGAHLLTDKDHEVENHHLFDPGVAYLINDEQIAFSTKLLESFAAYTNVIWLGPFYEARVNFRDIPELTKNGFRMNPVALEHFWKLDNYLKVVTADHPPNFRYLSFDEVVNVDRYFLLRGDCLTFSDPDHLSMCGEKLLGEKLKAFLPWSATD